MAVRTLKAFSVNMEDYNLRSFQKGQIIDDEHTIKLLKELECPVVDVEDRLTTTCIKCSHIFNSLTNRAKVLQVRAATISVTVGYQYFVYRNGEYVHENLVDAVLATGEPVAWVNAIKCPNCEYVY